MNNRIYSYESYYQLSPRQLFLLTLQEMEKSIGDTLIKTIDVSVPKDTADTSKLHIAATYEPNILARVYIKNDKTAHVLYYPGVDTDHTTLTDIPLRDIVTEVDKQLLEITQLNEITIKKHLIIGVYSKLSVFENHFVAATELDSKFVIINPKGSLTASFTNPNIEYLHTFLGKYNLQSEAIAAGIQSITDAKSCGYLVAAIHARTTSNQSTMAHLQEIEVKTAVAAYDTVLKSLLADNEQAKHSPTPCYSTEINDDWSDIGSDESKIVELDQTTLSANNAVDPDNSYTYGALGMLSGAGLFALGSGLLPIGGVGMGLMCAGGTVFTASAGIVTKKAIDQNSSTQVEDLTTLTLSNDTQVDHLNDSFIMMDVENETLVDSNQNISNVKSIYQTSLPLFASISVTEDNVKSLQHDQHHMTDFAEDKRTGIKVC